MTIYPDEELVNADWVKRTDDRLEALVSDDPVQNVFCPTGPGGGVDATCSPGGAAGPVPEGERTFWTTDKTSHKWADEPELVGPPRPFIPPTQPASKEPSPRTEKILKEASRIQVRDVESTWNNPCPHGDWCTDDDGYGLLTFGTNSGREYKVNAIYQRIAGMTVPDMRFSDPKEKDSYGVTGKGEAFEVFSRVVPAMVAYLQKKDLPAATFSAAEPSRQRLYDRLVRTIATALPDYVAATVERGSHRHYIVTKRPHLDAILKTTESWRNEDTLPQMIVNKQGSMEQWWSPEAWTPFPVQNIFCKTGPGGGIDPTCKEGGSTSLSAPKGEEGAPTPGAGGTSFPIKVNRSTDSEFKASFKAPNGSYTVRAGKTGFIGSTDDDWTLTFSHTASMWSPETFDLTGTAGKHVRQIMRSVGAATDEFIKQKRPEAVRFSANAAEHGRVALYDKIAPILARRHGYTSEKKVQSHTIYYALKRQD